MSPRALLAASLSLGLCGCAALKNVPGADLIGLNEETVKKVGSNLGGMAASGELTQSASFDMAQEHHLGKTVAASMLARLGGRALLSLGLLLSAIDARTTWLPLPLTRLAWLAMAAAIVLGALLGGWLQALRGIAGFVLAGALFGVAWLLTRGGFGFGDVRYAPLVGAATATASWTVLGWGLGLGSLVGAVVGLVRLGSGRRGAFAYAPSILAGGYLAAVLSWLTG